MSLNWCQNKSLMMLWNTGPKALNSVCNYCQYVYLNFCVCKTQWQKGQMRKRSLAGSFFYLVEVFSVEAIHLWQVDMRFGVHVSDSGLFQKCVFPLSRMDRYLLQTWHWCKINWEMWVQSLIYCVFLPAWHIFEAFDSITLYSGPRELKNSVKFIIQYSHNICGVFMSISTKDTLSIAFLDREQHPK